jgi:two-component system aerobic respiration control sensor histidine kinase ArcB
MKQVKALAQFYVDLLVKLGLIRFSFLLAMALVALAVVVQMSVTLILDGTFSSHDVVRSVCFGLLITPWAVYFLSVVVDQLEESRQRLSSMVTKLEEMRSRDLALNHQLQENVSQLQDEVEERQKVEEAHQLAMSDLENEVYHREHVQMALAEKSALLKSFLDASPDLIYYRNEKGRFSGCNRAMEELTGKTEKQLVGLTPWDVYSEQEATKIASTDQQLFENNDALCYEQWLKYPDGHSAIFELRKVPFFTRKGQRLGLMGFGRDITERKKYQEAQEKASRDKTAFISTISHELRTPLNGIVGLSRMLLDSPINDEQRSYLRTIQVSAMTLGHIFNDIIDLDKSERQNLALFPEPTHIADFISDMENISGLMAEQKGLRFDLERLTDLPECINIDGSRLRQILWNLLNNAMKFTPEGSVVLSISADIENDQAHMTFEVEDSGLGIPPSELKKIFAMYYQVKHKEGNLHAMGTGIGLAVSKQLANMMGGDITVTSDVGEGSTFMVTVTAPIVKTPKLLEIAQMSSAPLNILMVEDIELNITVAKSLLESLGHRVSVARTGKEALKSFDPLEFDLVFLDIQLPDMTGFDIAMHWRQMHSHLPPLIALTANAIKDKAKYLAQGMDDALSKPLNVKLMNLAIQKHQNRTESTDSESEVAVVVMDKMASKKEDFDAILDLEMLTSYVDIVGTEPVLQSIKMFESVMPEYMALLKQYWETQSYEALVEEAHKIKGAAGSVGLKRAQNLAKKAQSPERSDWQDNVGEWIQTLDAVYMQDIAMLKRWLWR